MLIRGFARRSSRRWTWARASAPDGAEIDIAETVAAAVPSIEKVRFVSSGTEAAMSAVRVARVTGRDKIIKMTGHYHGHIDALLVQAGSAATTLGTPNSPGVTPGATQDTLLCPFNDASAVADLLDHHRGQVAAVLLEPIAGNMGLVPPRPGYLETLRELTEKHGAILIFDEVMTGFRVAYGGAQARYGVTPDLTALGKIIGGGLPAAAYGGSARIMDHVSPAGPIYQAGTLSGNPLAMAAGLTTLRLLRDEPPYERLEALSTQLAEGLDRAAADAKVPHVVPRVGSMLTLFFTTAPCTTTRKPSRAIPGSSPDSSGRCSPAACTCRAASSRPPSSPPRTPRPTSTRRSRPPESRCKRSWDKTLPFAVRHIWKKSGRCDSKGPEPRNDR